MKTPPKPSFGQKLWSSVADPMLILLSDVILFLIVLAALLVGFLGITGLKAFGVRPERIELFETIHFYGYLSVEAVFICDMLFKIISESLRKKQT